MPTQPFWKTSTMKNNYKAVSLPEKDEKMELISWILERANEQTTEAKSFTDKIFASRFVIKEAIYFVGKDIGVEFDDICVRMHKTEILDQTVAHIKGMIRDGKFD